MQLDVVDLVAPALSFRSQFYLAPKVAGATNPNITYVSNPDEEGNTQLVYCKGFVTKSGKIVGDPAQAAITDPIIGIGPWDWMVATPQWIRQKMTENVWTNLATGKLESMSGHGVRRLPRWVNYDPRGLFSFQWTMSRPETDYLIIGAVPTGQNYPLITKNTDAIVRCTFSGPYPGAAIDDLPAGEDWREDYEWGGHINAAGVLTFSTEEVVWHRRQFGRYMWQAFAGNGQGGYSATPFSQSQQTIIKKLPFAFVPLQYVF